MRLLRTVQLVTLGLWVGSGLFFSYVVAPHVFHLFTERLLTEPQEGLPALDERIGRRLAGMTVGAIFPDYFWTQVVLGGLALASTAGLLVGTGRASGRSLTVQATLLGVAVAALAVQLVWVFPRSEVVLAEVHRLELAGKLTEADQLRRTFARWHGISQLLNLTTLAGAGLTLVLAAWQAAAPSASESVQGDTALRSSAQVEDG